MFFVAPSIFFDYIGAFWSYYTSDLVFFLAASFFIAVIIPGMLYTAFSYKPRDFLGHISRLVFWCLCAILVVFSPLSVILFFAYKKLYRILTLWIRDFRKGGSNGKS